MMGTNYYLPIASGPSALVDDSNAVTSSFPLLSDTLSSLPQSPTSLSISVLDEGQTTSLLDNIYPVYSTGAKSSSVLSHYQFNADFLELC
jgi:hypothetical protein